MIVVEDEALTLKGRNYLHALKLLNSVRKPTNYLEIGTRRGASLRQFDCPAISIDPAFAIDENVVGKKPALHFFQTTSDDFFARIDPTALLGDKVDTAFLDGMHVFEYLLRDFINIEKHCRRDSIVILHDCLPSDAHITSRSQSDPRQKLSKNPGWWAGDVWKVPVVLRQHRPDLAVHVLDCAPTGLVLVTDLDPGSTVLGDRYDAIVRDYADLDLADYGLSRLVAESAVRSEVEFMTAASLAGHGLARTAAAA